MSPEQRLEQLNELISELEHDMWYNIHTDSPHRAAKVKGWNDQLKEQANVLRIQIETKTNN
jgi:hypothetical protein